MFWNDKYACVYSTRNKRGLFCRPHLQGVMYFRRRLFCQSHIRMLVNVRCACLMLAEPTLPGDLFDEFRIKTSLVLFGGGWAL